MNTTIPPSIRRQEWHLIAAMSITTFVLSTGFLTYNTWHIGSDWGHFKLHWPPLWNSLKNFSSNQENVHWVDYWNQITDYEFESHFVAHLSIPLLISLILACFVGRLFYYPGGRDRLIHVTGPKLYWKSEAIKHARKCLKIELRDNQPVGLNLHPSIAIPRSRESGNIFVGGSQGTGKSIFISPIAQQIISRGQRAFIYDEKREYTALFYDPKTTILIAPWDQRGIAWNISADATNSVQAQLIAERLIPDSHDPLWSNGARMILVGLIEILNNTKKHWGWQELADAMSLDEDQLMHLLSEYYPRASRFVVKNSKTTQSFFAQLLGFLGWIYTLARAWPTAYKAGFSITEWVRESKSSKKILIVQADKRYRDIGAPLANSLIAIMTSKVLSLGNTRKREFWLFIDELGNLPKNDSLIEWMSLGRSKGCRIVAGIQSIAQLKILYTENGADALLSMFTTFVSMRVGSAGSTSTYTAKSFGERVVERPTMSISSNGNTNTTWQKELLPLVSPTDLAQLPQPSRLGAQGYLLVPGWKAVYRLSWPFPKLPIIASEYCPAKWTNHKNTLNEITNETRRTQLERRRRDAFNKRN